MRANLSKYIILFFLCGFYSCSYAQKSQSEFDNMLSNLLSHSVNEVKVDDLKKRRGRIVYLDAREKEEYEVSHIENSIWVGFDYFDKTKLSKIPKSAQIIVYCSVGYRSEKIAKRIEKMGFENVSNLYGGIFSWKDSGMKLVNSKGKPTNQVHTYNKKWSQWLRTGEKIY